MSMYPSASTIGPESLRPRQLRGAEQLLEPAHRSRRPDPGKHAPMPHRWRLLFTRLVLLGALFQSVATPQAFAVGTCTLYDEGAQVGTVVDSDLDELSGLAASQLNPGAYWAITDTSEESYLYALGEDGSVLDLLWVSKAASVDWEDVAVGPCLEACSCVYVGDIGDPAKGRNGGVVYRFSEPLLGKTNRVTAESTALTFTWPDEAHDAETLLVDPRNGNLYIVTKEDDGVNGVFKFPVLEPQESPIVLERVGDATFAVGGKLARRATGGAVAPDGGRLVVRSEETVQEYSIPLGAPLEAAFAGTPLISTAPYAAQGEGVTYSADGQRLLLDSEFVPSPIHALTCTAGEPRAYPAIALATACDDATDSGPVYGCACRSVESSSASDRERVPGSALAAGLLLAFSLGWTRSRRYGRTGGRATDART